MKRLGLTLLLVANNVNAHTSLPAKASSLLPVAVNSPKVVDRLPVLSESHPIARGIFGKLLDKRVPDIAAKSVSGMIIASTAGLFITGKMTGNSPFVSASLSMLPSVVFVTLLSFGKSPLSLALEEYRERWRAKLASQLNHLLGEEVYYLRGGDDGELPSIVYGTVEKRVSNDKFMIKIGTLDNRAAPEITSTLEAYEEVEISRIGGMLIPNHEDVGKYVRLISDDNQQHVSIIAKITKVFTDGQVEIITEKGIDNKGKGHDIYQNTVFIHKATLLDRLNYDDLPIAASPDFVWELPIPAGVSITRHDIIGKLVDRHVPDVMLKSLPVLSLIAGGVLAPTGMLIGDVGITTLSIVPSFLGVVGVGLLYDPSLKLFDRFDRYRERRQTKLAKQKHLGQEVYYLRDNVDGQPPSVVYGTIERILPDGRKEVKVGSLNNSLPKELDDFAVYDAVEPTKIGGVLVPNHEDIGRYVQLISDNPDYLRIVAKITKVFTDGQLEVVAEYGIDYDNNKHPLQHYSIFLHKSQLPKEDIIFFSK